MQMAKVMSYNPSNIAKLGRGDISPEHIADVVVFDPKETYKIDVNTFESKGKNTPFDGWEVTGKVITTICGGRIVYQSC